MSVIEKLASSLQRRDEVPNQELAAQIVKKKDKQAVKELIDLIKHENKSIQFDCIKVLYEIGELNPSLVASYAFVFIDLLKDKHNRNVWGAMHALDTVTLENPKYVYTNLSKIMLTAETGSVITRDHAVSILLKLYLSKSYADNVFTLLIEILKHCPENQLPMYAEMALPVIIGDHKEQLSNVLSQRVNKIDKATRKARVEKVIKKLQSGK
jgi:hypothetical protein